MRDRMAMHHVNVSCSSCHSLFEPIGLALENLDGVGAWRLKDEGQPIDPTEVPQTARRSTAWRACGTF